MSEPVPAAGEAPVVEAREVAKLYGDVMALQRVSLRVEAGLVGLIGPNGSGKSTLMRIAVGELRPTRGRVRVLGRDPFADPPVRRHIGFSPEGDPFWPDATGREMVALLTGLHGLPPDEAAERTEHALDRVGLTEAGGRAIGGYSLGMRQRLKLAQAIAHGPRLLVLDEPLNGCDPLIKASLKELFVELARAGATVLLSSHDLDELESMTDRIVLINHGRVVAEGRIDELRERLTAHPRTLRIELHAGGGGADGAPPPARALATCLLGRPGVLSVRLEPGEAALRVETSDADAFYDALGAAVLEGGFRLRRLATVDADLRSVFRYVVGAGAAGGEEP